MLQKNLITSPKLFKSIRYLGAKIWKLVPNDLKEVTSIELFKKELNVLNLSIAHIICVKTIFTEWAGCLRCFTLCCLSFPQMFFFTWFYTILWDFENRWILLYDFRFYYTNPIAHRLFQTIYLILILCMCHVCNLCSV